MTVETDLLAVLELICPNSFTDVAPPDVARPYVTFQQIGGEAVGYVGGELPAIRNGTFQINVWADRRQKANELILEVEAAILAAPAFQGRALSAFVADYDEDMQLYGARQDFDIWSPR